MSGKRAKVSGASQKVTNDIVTRLKNIRALWFAVHNQPNATISELSSEFYHKVGELLEGKALEDLTYHVIDRNRVLQHVEDS